MGETSAGAQSAPILSLKGIRKRFGGVIALDGVDLELTPGEIHGLVGENGAGKSTLIKIMSGIIKRDDGTMTLDGQAYEPASPREAKHAGVQVVHQEFSQLPYMSVAENICFENLPRNAFGILDRSTLKQKARAALDTIGLGEVDVAIPVERLGIAHRQLVEIARALMSDSRILILDEPTATLTAHEARRLFELLGLLKARGVAIVFVSHHLDEIFDHCQQVTVMRNGKTVFTKPISETNSDDLIQGMVGRNLVDPMHAKVPSAATTDILLRVESLRHSRSPNPNGVSFTLHKGEILGIGGLIGAGRTELLRAIFGIDKALSGDVFIEGAKTQLRSPAEAIEAGIAFVTEDRKDEGLILEMPIAANITLADMKAVSRFGLLDRQSELQLAKEKASDLKLKFGALGDRVATLSGGNQQKVVLAKWLARSPSILLLDEPTRGVDVGAKAEIYALLRSFAAEGRGLLVVSSELPELMALSDRILVMANHSITGELTREEFSEERILNLAYKTSKSQQHASEQGMAAHG
ncbi:sugar ABC transporter ATP-binding protein [Brucella sp. HL-2]|nr:sugar ABC transporter ATP-binding protein [Brucella sp. HL-2]MCV9909068.1 sugar ABC transporter ATP-binding protein [Brucella sp. HL-2]